MDEFSAKNILAKVAERGRREAINEVKVLHYDKLVEENAKLKEELNGVKFGETKNLYDIIDEYKSTLDKIREFNILLNNQYLEDLLAKHEGKQ
jgi:hypothetical protein